MDAKKLASLLRGGPGGPLVIDSRSFVEYNRGHVRSSVNICCSKLVKRRLQQGKVTISELIQPAVRSQVPAFPPHWPGPAQPRTDHLPAQAPSPPGSKAEFLSQVHGDPWPGQPPPSLPLNPNWVPQGQNVDSHSTSQATVGQHRLLPRRPS